MIAIKFWKDEPHCAEVPTSFFKGKRMKTMYGTGLIAVSLFHNGVMIGYHKKYEIAEYF